MKNLTRFLCIAALAVGIAGGATATASAQGQAGRADSAAVSAADSPCKPPKPGDTEWGTSPSTHCPRSV